MTLLCASLIGLTRLSCLALRPSAQERIRREKPRRLIRSIERCDWLIRIHLVGVQEMRVMSDGQLPDIVEHRFALLFNGRM